MKLRLANKKIFESAVQDELDKYSLNVIFKNQNSIMRENKDHTYNCHLLH